MSKGKRDWMLCLYPPSRHPSFLPAGSSSAIPAAEENQNNIHQGRTPFQVGTPRDERWFDGRSMMSWKDPWKDEQGSKGGSKSRIPFGRHADTSVTFGADENDIGGGQLELILGSPLRSGSCSGAFDISACLSSQIHSGAEADQSVERRHCLHGKRTDLKGRQYSPLHSLTCFGIPGAGTLRHLCPARWSVRVGGKG